MSGGYTAAAVLVRRRLVCRTWHALACRAQVPGWHAGAVDPLWVCCSCTMSFSLFPILRFPVLDSLIEVIPF